MSNVSKGRLQVLKKTFAVLTALTTMLSLAGFAAYAPQASAAFPADFGLQEGNTISAPGSNDPDIYIVNAPGYKRLFLNPVIFNFYGHLGGFPAVKTVAATTRDAFPTSGLFRNCETNDPKVYGVETTGEDTGILHWVNTSGAQAVADDANFFNKVFCINNNEFNWYAKGSDYTSVSQVPVYVRGGGVVTGPLSASLASDNPAAGTIIVTQAMADLAHFQVNGSGAVTSVELKRLGVSGDSTLEEVFLFVNGVRVSDAGNVSSGMVTFNNAAGLFQAGSTLVVKSDIAGTAGQTVGIQLTKLNTTTVSVSGNLMTVAADPGLASYTLVASGTGPGDIDPQSDVAVWKATMNLTVEDVYLKRLTLREIGSIDNGDVRNFRLLVDGVQVATATGLTADGYVTFLLNSRIAVGSSRELKVIADVVGGASRTMQFSLRGAYDIEVADESYGVGVESGSTFPISMTASTISNAPTVTVTKATNSPSGDVVATSTGVTLGRFEAKAFGESIKIETLAVTASVSNTGGGVVNGLNNGRVLINGVQYGSTAILANGTNASQSFTTNYTIPLGATAIIEIVADLKDSVGDELGAGDSVQVRIDGGNTNNNAQGVSSAAIIDAPNGNVSANTLSVVTGTVTLSRLTSYSNQNVTIPKTAYKIGAWVVTGSSVEAVNLTNLSFDVDEVTNATFKEEDLTNVYVRYGSVQTSAKAALSTGGQDNDYSISYSLAKNEVLIVELYADLGSNATANDSFKTDLSLTGTGAVSGAAITGVSDKEGQTIANVAGTFSTSVDSGTAKLAASNSAVGAGTWRFRGENDAFTISELRFKVASGSNQQDAVNSVTLKDGGSAIGTAFLSQNTVGTYVATFTGLNIAVGTEKALTVDINTADVNSIVTTGKNVAVTLDLAKYRPSSGTEATDPTDRVSSNIFVHDSYPSLVKNDLGTSLAVGTQSLAQFVVTPVGGAVGLHQVRFDITKSTGISIASASANDFELYAGGAPLDVASVSHTGLGTNQTTGTLIFEFASEQTLSSVTTYRVDVNVVATGGAAKSINTALSMSAATATPAAATSVPTSATVIWTDRSASSHSTSSADWMNSSLLPGLPMSWGKTS